VTVGGAVRVAVGDRGQSSDGIVQHYSETVEYQTVSVCPIPFTITTLYPSIFHSFH